MAELRVIESQRERCKESTVSLLEQALEEAKNGEIVAVALAVVRPGGFINTGFSESDSVGQLLGACTLLQSRVLANLE